MSTTVAATPRRDESPSFSEATPAPRSEDLIGTSLLPPAYLSSNEQLDTATPNLSSIAASQDDAIRTTRDSITGTSTDALNHDTESANDSSSITTDGELEDSTSSEDDASSSEEESEESEAGEGTGESDNEESEEETEEDSEESEDEVAGNEGGEESTEEEKAEESAEHQSADDESTDHTASPSSAEGGHERVNPDEREGIEALVAKLPSMRPIVPPYVPGPPPQAIQRRDEIIKRTGYTPDTHHAKVRQATEQVTQAARDAQRRMINRIGLIGKGTRMSIEEMADEIKSAAQAAVAQIDHAINKAKGGIKEAEKIRAEYLTSATMLVGTALEKHRDTVTVNIANSLREGSAAVRELDQRAQQEFTSYLAQARAGINEIPTAGKGTRIPDPPLPPGAPARRKQKPPKQPKFFKSEDTTPELTTFISTQAQTKSRGDGPNCESYYIDRATPYMEGYTRRTQQSLVKAATTKAESLDSAATRAQYLICLLGLTTPAAEHHENDESEATRRAEDALREQMTEVEYARHRAQLTIKEKSGMAIEYMDTDLRKNLTSNLWKSANKAIKSFRKQALAAEIAQHNNAAALAESYRQLVAQINHYLPQGQFLDARKLVPQLLKDRDKAHALQKQHELLAKQQSEATLQQMNEAKRQQVEGLQKSAQQGAENVANVVTQTAFDMEVFVQQVTSGASTGANAAMAAGLTYANETAEGIVRSIGGPTSQGVLQIQNAAVGFLNGNIGAAEQMQYSRLDGFVESMKDTSDSGQLTSPMEQAKNLFAGKADRLHNHMPEPASGGDILAGAAVVGAGALLLGPGVLVVGAVGLGSYLYNHNPSENGVITELGDVVYPGTRAIGEVFARKGYGNLENRIRSRLDNPEKQQALDLFNESPRVRGDARRHIAERSTDLFGYNSAAREAALSGMSAEESSAMNPDDVRATRDLLARELNVHQRDVAVAFLAHNREAAVAAMTRRSLDEGTRSASWGWLFTAEAATRASDTARVNAVQRMDADLRRVLAIENSFATIMTGEEISSSRALTFREFAYLTDPSRRSDRSFSDADARRAFIDYASRPHTAQLIGPGTIAAAGLQTALGPLGPLALAAGLASDQTTVTMSSDARAYITAMVNNDDQNSEAVTRARGVYEIRRAEAEGGRPSETTQLTLAQALENPRLARYERDMNDPRLTPEERSRAEREYREERERHLGRLQSLARDLGANPADIATPEMAEDYMRRRVGDIYARTDTVASRLGLYGTTHRRFGEEMISHGRARLDTSVALATHGIGTHEDLLTHAYAERSTTEIAEANARWAEEHGGESMEDMLGITNNRYTSPQDLGLFAASPAAWLLFRAPETSGDLAMQLEVLARGNPTNDMERLAIARLRQEQQTRGFALIADAWMSGTPEADQMTSTSSSMASTILMQALQHDRSLGESFDINNPMGIYRADGTLDPRIRDAAFNERGNFRGDRSFFTTSVGSMGQAADAYRAGVDRREAILTTFITAMAVVASIAAMLIPGVNMVVAGVVIALVAGAATIAVKAGMRGARYGWEEMATDVATTAIEAATAGIGGGLGGGLGKTGFIGVLGRVGVKLENALGGKIAAAIVREAVVNAVSTAASTAIQDDVWKDGLGRGFERVLNGAIRGAVVGGLSGGISTALTTGLGARASAVQQGPAKLDMLQRFSNTFPKASEMLRESIANSVGTLVSEAAGIGIDYAQGNFRGTFLDAVKQVGIATLRESVSGALRSGITAMHKENYRKLLSAAQNSPHINQAELRLLRLVGISAGVVDYGTSLKSLAHDIAQSRDIIARMPPSIRNDLVGMDLNSLQHIAALLDSASIDYRSGKNLDNHIQFMRGLADLSPGFDPRNLMAAIDAAIDTRRAATHEPLNAEQQQALRQRLGAEMHESLKFALDTLPVDALQHLTDAELKQAATMIAAGNYNTQHADQLMRAVKSRNPNIDEHLFLKNLQGAVVQSRELQQQVQNQQQRTQRHLVALVPPESAHIFAGLPPLDAALAHQLIRVGNEGTPHQREMLFQAAKKSNPHLTGEEFSRFIAKAAGDVRQRRAVEANQQRIKREAGMTNVPEHLRSTLSALPEAGLVELRLRQMEGSVSPAEKARLIEMARKTNPDVDMRQLSDAIDQTVATKPMARISDAEAAELRKHLVSGVPEDQRALIQNTPIVVLSDAEFTAMTRSNKGQAVTMIIDGKPVIVMREGANPRALREEGIHALQARDPQWAKHIGSLDEQHLANWDDLPLEQQIILYRNKVALELDAQQRMIASIEADIGNAKTPQEKAALQRQLEQTQLAHANLSRRMGEVGNMDAMDLANIKAGFTERPQWLDQPARLFQKADEPETIQRIAEQRESLLKKITGDTPLSPEQEDLLKRMSVEDIAHLIKASGDDVSQVKRILDLSNKTKDPDTAVNQLRRTIDELPPGQRHFVLEQLSGIDPKNIAGMLGDLHRMRNLAGSAAAFDKVLDALPFKEGKLTQKSLREIANLFSHLAANKVPVESLFRNVGHADDLAAVLVRLKQSGDPAATMTELIQVVKAAADYSPEQAANIIKTMAGVDHKDFPDAVRNLAEIRTKLPNAESFNALLDVLTDSGADKAKLLNNLNTVLSHIDPRAAVALVSLLHQISDSDRIETLADIAMIAEHVLPHLEKTLLGSEGTKLLSVLVETIATQRNWRVMADDMFSLLTLLTELPDTPQNKEHIKKIMDYLLSARGDLTQVAPVRLHETEGDVRFQSARENAGLANLAGDIIAAMKILRSSANPEVSIASMVKRQGKEGTLAGGDPWRTYLGEQKAHWDALQKNTSHEAVAFVKALQEATKNLGWSHEELGALREMMPWFTALAKAKGIDLNDATAMAKLMQDVFDRGFADFKTRNLSSEGKLQALERAFREMAVEAKSGINLRNLASVEELKANHPEKVKELLKRLGITEEQLMKRGDADVLLQHIATLVAREDFYTKMRDMANEIGANGAGIKQNITEVAGEIALAQHILKNNPDFELAIPFGKGTGFDQVWMRTVNGRTEYIIGEAKGAGASLGNPAKGPQMSAEWVLNTLKEMLASPVGSPEHQLAVDMLAAIRAHLGASDGAPSPVRGIVIEESTPPDHHDRTTNETGLGGYDFRGLTLPG